MHCLRNLLRSTEDSKMRSTFSDVPRTAIIASLPDDPEQRNYVSLRHSRLFSVGSTNDTQWDTQVSRLTNRFFSLRWDAPPRAD
jgi:hypothetical protein